MAKEHLTADDFMKEHSVSARRLQGIDQAAIQGQDRCKEPYAMDEPWSAREKDYHMANTIRKRSADRGSACFRREDMMGVPPCPPPEKHR